MANEYLQAVYDEMQDKLSLGSFDEFSANVKDKSYRDAIKEESKKYIDVTDFDTNIEPVKKKDNTQQPSGNSTQKQSVVTNDISQSKSPLVSPLKPEGNKIQGVPYFGLDITVKKQNAETIAKAKKILGTGTPSPYTEQQVLPPVKDKKTVALQTLTGKDLSYDKVSELSDVSNQNYAEILDFQKEKVTTDNTYTQSPSQFIIQQQDVKKEVEKAKKNPFKINDAAAQFKQTQSKNPAVLKSLTDNAIAQDELRKEEAIYTDASITERFSVPDKTTAYIPFHNYVSLDEIAISSPD
jgi:hypothetical protein